MGRHLSVTNCFNTGKAYSMKRFTFLAVKSMKEISNRTGALLTEKGFKNNLCSAGFEKIVLLNTEIGELTDAIKKGLGGREEGLELADIIIRASNFCCAKDVSESFESYYDFIERLGDRSVYDVNLTLSNCDVEDKFMIIDKMIDTVSSISNNLKIS
ncbi:MAG: hypothetical protein ACRCX2_00025, partial [Paraclostridium sp.]